jgi:hypothetical protein
VVSSLQASQPKCCMHFSYHIVGWFITVMHNRCSAAHRCAAEAIYVCYEIFTSHNYNHNEVNNCLSCFLLCLSFQFLYYSRTDRGQTRSTKWNWKVTHPSPPPPQYVKWGWCAAMTLRQYLVCRECRKVAQHWSITTLCYQCWGTYLDLRNMK